jgi:hypothetical protein
MPTATAATTTATATTTTTARWWWMSATADRGELWYQLPATTATATDEER